MKWSSRSFGSRFKYGFFQALIRFGLAGLARFLMLPVPLYYALKSKSRNRAMPYLARRFPEVSSYRQMLNAFSLYRNFANVLFDRLVIVNGGSIPVEQDPGTVELIKKSLGERHGIVLVSAHFGCWQTGLLALKALNAKMAVVFWQEERLEHGFFHYEKDVEVINANGGIESAIKMRNILKANGILIFMGDRMTPGDRKSAISDFMGGRIRLPVFPYLLARTTDAPVIFAASVRGKNKILGLPAMRCPNDADAPQEFAAFLETLTREYPLDFFNFYDMWSEDDERRDN